MDSAAKFIDQLLGQHLRRYPRMELADVYKLLHQAALGAGHAVSGVDDARGRLRAEAASLGDGPPDPIADPISQDGGLARIHLRPYVAAGRDLDALAHAFIRTAQHFTASPETLPRYCGCLADLAEATAVPSAACS